MLALTILFGIGFVANLTAPVYEDFVRWPTSAALTAVLAALTVWMRSNAKKAEAEYAARQRAVAEAKQREMEEKQREREAREAAIRAEKDRFRYERFPVAGVTFKNDDGTDRQKILREIALNEDGTCEVWFDENEDLGEESGISVLTENGQVGNIRRNDKKKLRRFFDRTANTMYLSVERFENDDGDKIYRADVVIVMDKNDPEQRWYFDDLPESEV